MLQGPQFVRTEPDSRRVTLQGSDWHQNCHLRRPQPSLETCIERSEVVAPVHCRGREPGVRQIAAVQISIETDAATNTLTSGVIARRFEHRLVAERVNAGDETSAALEDLKFDLASLGRTPGRAQAQLQAFLDQSGQRGALLCRRGFGAGQQAVIEVERCFPAGGIQIPVSSCNPTGHPANRRNAATGL